MRSCGMLRSECSKSSHVTSFNQRVITSSSNVVTHIPKTDNKASDNHRHSFAESHNTSLRVTAKVMMASNSCDRVLGGVPELLEKILLQLPPRDLLLAQGVSKTFRDNIEASNRYV